MIGRRMTLELHPLNRDFEWVRHTGPFRRVTEAQARLENKVQTPGYFELGEEVGRP